MVVEFLLEVCCKDIKYVYCIEMDFDIVVFFFRFMGLKEELE